MSLQELRDALAGKVTKALIDRLLSNFESAITHFQSGRLVDGLNAAGRFSEVIFSIIHLMITGETELNIKNEILYKELQSDKKLPDKSRDSLMFLYRSARDIYVLRSRKKAAHESEIDPTKLDAAYVSLTMRWTLAELIRMHHNSSEDHILRLVNDLVKKENPLIEEIDGYPVLLRKLSCPAHILFVLNYYSGQSFSIEDLEKMIPYFKRDSLRRSLSRLESSRKAFRNPDNGKYTITQEGVKDVEEISISEFR